MALEVVRKLDSVKDVLEEALSRADNVEGVVVLTIERGGIRQLTANTFPLPEKMFLLEMAKAYLIAQYFNGSSMQT